MVKIHFGHVSNIAQYPKGSLVIRKPPHCEVAEGRRLLQLWIRQGLHVVQHLGRLLVAKVPDVEQQLVHALCRGFERRQKSGLERVTLVLGWRGEDELSDKDGGVGGELGHKVVELGVVLGD